MGGGYEGRLQLEAVKVIEKEELEREKRRRRRRDVDSNSHPSNNLPIGLTLALLRKFR